MLVYLPAQGGGKGFQETGILILNLENDQTSFTWGVGWIWELSRGGPAGVHVQQLGGPTPHFLPAACPR